MPLAQPKASTNQLPSNWRRRIRAYRVARKWSQGELGRRARPDNPISHTTISGIETGKSDPQISTLEDIALAFGMPLAVLVAPGPAVPTLPERFRRQAIGGITRDMTAQFEKIVADVVEAWQKIVIEQQGA